MAPDPTPPATYLPPAEGVRLDGTPFSIPDGLAAPATLVVITFQDDVAPLSGQWVRLAGRLAAGHPGLEVLDLSVLPPRIRLLGDLPLLSARSRAEAQGRAGQTAVVYTKRKPFRKALGIERESAVTALLVGPRGHVVWRGDGEIDLHEVESLEPAVQALVGASAGPGSDTHSGPAQ
ncbi:MAG TPA: hypothetical protein VF576_04995 [Rubricoccaceae bacterium]|jgi:hypothetical protein